MTPTVTIPLTVPEAMAPFVADGDDYQVLVRNAMMLFPRIKNLEMSHGYAAGLLGVSKRTLIELYDSLGMPYIDMTAEDLFKELSNFEEATSETQCL